MTTNQQKEQMLQALENSLGVVGQACDKTGISRETHGKWLENDSKYAEKVRNIEEKSIDFAESKLLKQVSDGNINAISFYLKTKGKHRGYTERFISTENDYDVNHEDQK